MVPLSLFFFACFDVVDFRCRFRFLPLAGLGVGLLSTFLLKPGLSLFVRCEHHHHVAAVLAGVELHLADMFDLGCHIVEDLPTEIGVLHFSTPEHDRHLDLVTLAQELLYLLGLGGEVPGADLRPVLHLLDREVRRLLSGLFGPLVSLVLELPVIHDPANWWVGLICDFDKVEAGLTGDVQRFRQWFDTDLFAILADKADLAGTDAIIDPRFVGWRCYRPELLVSTEPP